jgi:hypothetical protein
MVDSWGNDLFCSLCGIYFRTKRIMREHNEQHHPDDGWIVIPPVSEAEIEHARNDLIELRKELA